MPTLVLLRHGESVWNKENRFTGWVDVDLSDKGREEAAAAGGFLRDAAHGNSLRALLKHLDGISDDEIVGLNIPTGFPLVYELDDQLRPVRKTYLPDDETAASAAAAVASQGQAKA